MNLNRKDLASFLSGLLKYNVTVDQIRRNEKRWGFFSARIRFNPRVVLYDCQKVESACVAMGWMQKKPPKSLKA